MFLHLFFLHTCPKSHSEASMFSTSPTSPTFTVALGLLLLPITASCRKLSFVTNKKVYKRIKSVSFLPQTNNLISMGWHLNQLQPQQDEWIEIMDFPYSYIPGNYTPKTSTYLHPFLWRNTKSQIVVCWKVFLKENRPQGEKAPP